MSDKVEVYFPGGELSHIEDNRNLSDTQNSVSDAINSYRDSLVNDGGIWYLGHHFSTDATSRGNMLGAISTVIVGQPLPSTFTWRDEDNNNVPMNSTQLTTLGVLAAAYVEQAYSASWSHKANVSACASLADIDALPGVDKMYWPDGNMDGTMPISVAPELDYGFLNTDYSFNLNVHGGIAPYSVSIANGSLPDGLMLSNSEITGTPTSTGSYVFDVEIIDSTANTPLTAAQTYTLNIV